MHNLSAIGSLGSGSYFVYANAISADGLHIVGYGYTGGPAVMRASHELTMWLREATLKQ
jgi:uncharacterized membrane protein